MTRTELYDHIKKNNLGSKIYTEFNKPYSSLSTDVLNMYVNKHNRKQTQEHPTQTKEVSTVNVGESDKATMEVEALCKKYGSFNVLGAVIANGFSGGDRIMVLISALKMKPLYGMSAMEAKKIIGG